MPESEIEPLPQYPWLTAADECAPPREPGRPFAGDGLLEKEIRRLISQYGIKSAVETGTFQGATTRALAAMVPEVHTVEISPAFFAQSRQRLDGVTNVRQYCGATPDVLPGLLPQVRKPALYYLDAHWNGQLPAAAGSRRSSPGTIRSRSSSCTTCRSGSPRVPRRPAA